MDHAFNHEETIPQPISEAISDEDLSGNIPPTSETIELLQGINDRLEELTNELKNNEAFVYYKKINRPHWVFLRNFGVGIARGLGMTIGLTVVIALLVMILKSIINLPLIGDYIAEIIKIVQEQLVLNIP